MTGTVKWFNAEKGYGFISPDGEGGTPDVFVHYSQIDESEPRVPVVVDGERREYRGLLAEDRVVFDVGTGRKGPEAQNVRRA